MAEKSSHSSVVAIDRSLAKLLRHTGYSERTPLPFECCGSTYYADIIVLTVCIVLHLFAMLRGRDGNWYAQCVRVKIISMGALGVGKSCLIKRFCEERVRWGG